MRAPVKVHGHSTVFHSSLLLTPPSITTATLPQNLPTMPSSPPNRTRVQKRKRQEEEDADSSLSEHDSREFDDATLARNDPHHQVGIPEEKRKKPREDKEL